MIIVSVVGWNEKIEAIRRWRYKHNSEFIVYNIWNNQSIHYCKYKISDIDDYDELSQ